MTERELKPSALPPNPSVGELVTEIDRARHDAARTVAALAAKLDVKTQVQRKAQNRLDTLRSNGRRLVDATPEPVAHALGTAAQYAKRVPVQARIAAVVILLAWLGTRRGR